MYFAGQTGVSKTKYTIKMCGIFNSLKPFKTFFLKARIVGKNAIINIKLFPVFFKTGKSFKNNHKVDLLMFFMLQNKCENVLSFCKTQALFQAFNQNLIQKNQDKC